MAPALGKRKRVSRAELEQASRSPTSSSSSDSGESDGEDLQAIFRRAFEAKFKPLAVEAKKPKLEEARLEGEDGGEDERESGWSGLSDDDDDDDDDNERDQGHNIHDVEIIEYKDTSHSYDEETERAAKRAFMSSKPPTSSTSTAKSNASSNKKPQDESDLTESTNLKNDLALQKLLRESHLLSASSSGTSTPTTLSATGILRHKSTDLHLQSLGAKSSVFTQKKMPMAQRKHMAQKAKLTEEKRRAHAREAGIVLEKEQRVAKVDREKKRERGVGGPSIGRFKGGTLSLSKRDVRSITGGGGGKAKGKGGKKGKR